MFKGLITACVVGAALLVGSLVSNQSAFAQRLDASETGVFVNRQQMTHGQVSALAQMVGAPIGPGQYWYDHSTGLYGELGGPSLGQVAVGMTAILFPVAADASGGRTRVFINGRALHPTELADLQKMYGAVPDGNYFMNAFGQIAPEAYPPSATLPADTGFGNPRSAYGVVDSGQGIYLPELGGRSGGTHVGRASDGCIYVSAGEYSTEVCD